MFNQDVWDLVAAFTLLHRHSDGCSIAALLALRGMCTLGRRAVHAAVLRVFKLLGFAPDSIDRRVLVEFGLLTSQPSLARVVLFLVVGLESELRHVRFGSVLHLTKAEYVYGALTRFGQRLDSLQIGHVLQDTNFQLPGGLPLSASAEEPRLPRTSPGANRLLIALIEHHHASLQALDVRNPPPPILSYRHGARPETTDAIVRALQTCPQLTSITASDRYLLGCSARDAALLSASCPLRHLQLPFGVELSDEENYDREPIITDSAHGNGGRNGVCLAAASCLDLVRQLPSSLCGSITSLTLTKAAGTTTELLDALGDRVGDHLTSLSIASLGPADDHHSGAVVIALKRFVLRQPHLTSLSLADATCITAVDALFGLDCHAVAGAFRQLRCLQLTMRASTIPLQRLASLAASCGGFQQLDLRFERATMGWRFDHADDARRALSEIVLHSAVSLTRLKLINGSCPNDLVDQDLVDQIFTTCGSLTHLSLMSIGSLRPTLDVLGALAGGPAATKLEYLSLTMPGARHHGRDNVHGDDSDQSIGAGLPRLITLQVTDAHLSDAFLRGVALGCHRLRYLALPNCAGFSDEGIFHLSQGCPYLEGVDLRGAVDRSYNKFAPSITALNAHLYGLRFVHS